MKRNFGKLLSVLFSIFFITAINGYTDFTRLPTQWTISGTITDGTNALPDVTVSITKNGAYYGSTTTDGSGNYTFASLNEANTYVITPANIHYTFAPVDRTYPNLGSDINNADFIGTLNRWTISGTITDGANPISSVTVNLSGDSTASTITDASGNYSFVNLDTGATYVITPTMKNWTFTPENAPFPNLDSNKTQDFIGEKTWHKNLDNLTAYPNPCKGDSVKFKNLTINCTIRIYNIKGNLVFEAKSDLPEYEWQVINDDNKKIVSGVYIFVITNENGEQKKGKIVIIK